MEVVMADPRPVVLAVRLDSAGDVLLMGPALRAVAAGAARLDLLCSPVGRAAAELLPGVDRVLTYDAPWAGFDPPTVTDSDVPALLAILRAGAYDQALIFTSYHQSPLPMALLAHLAGIGQVSAASEDYPGSLLQLRWRRRVTGDDHGTGGPHEVKAALALAAAAGFPLPSDDDGRLRIRPVGPRADVALPPAPYVVLHPGAAVPSRAIGPVSGAAYAAALADGGWAVVVTGGAEEVALARAVTPAGGRCLAGELSLAELAVVLAGAHAVVVGNTGPMHLAAAVGTAVVCLFAPVVPVQRWAPWGVPHVILGDQGAPCAGSRVRECRTDPQGCLARVRPAEVVAAVEHLVHRAPVLAGTVGGMQ